MWVVQYMVRWLGTEIVASAGTYWEVVRIDRHDSIS